MKKTKILWICNVPIPRIAENMNINVPNICGWLTGFANSIEKIDDIELYIAFPQLGIKEIKRVKPCAFVQKIVLGLDEGCNWAGYCEDGMRLDGDERTVLKFDREGFPLE